MEVAERIQEIKRQCVTGITTGSPESVLKRAMSRAFTLCICIREDELFTVRTAEV